MIWKYFTEIVHYRHIGVTDMLINTNEEDSLICFIQTRWKEALAGWLYKTIMSPQSLHEAQHRRTAPTLVKSFKKHVLPDYVPFHVNAAADWFLEIHWK